MELEKSIQKIGFLESRYVSLLITLKISLKQNSLVEKCESIQELENRLGAFHETNQE